MQLKKRNMIYDVRLNRLDIYTSFINVSGNLKD